MNEIKNLLLEKQKEVWLPICSSTEQPQNTLSKYGGKPTLYTNDLWPECPCCMKRMTFFFQLDLRSTPIFRQNKLLQLFYCTNEFPNCSMDEDAFFPFSKVTIVRSIDPSEEEKKNISSDSKLLNEVFIIDWQKGIDFPSIEEVDALGFEENHIDAIYELIENETTFQNIMEDKLGGWPSWTQGKAYPKNKTEVYSELIYQITSNKYLDYMFGDDGISYITSTNKDTERMAFQWMAY